MSWIIDALKKYIGAKGAYAIAFIVLGILIATSAPKFFVTHPTLAGELRPMKQTDISTEIKLIEFQKGQVLQRKWDLEDAVDLQEAPATNRQKGRLEELIIEMKLLQGKLASLEKDLKDCK